MRLPDGTYCSDCRGVEDGVTWHRHKGVPFTLIHFRLVACDKHKHLETPQPQRMEAPREQSQEDEEG